VKKNQTPEEMAERFCKENGLQHDRLIKREMSALLNEYLK
jgi:hypothetical protein